MDEPRRSRLPVLVLAVTTALVAFPVLYTLSVGPYVWLVSQGYLELNGPLDVVYAPLQLLAKSFQPLRSFLGWYIEIFKD